jgi:hypothetical protein
MSQWTAQEVVMSEFVDSFTRRACGQLNASRFRLLADLKRFSWLIQDIFRQQVEMQQAPA